MEKNRPSGSERSVLAIGQGWALLVGYPRVPSSHRHHALEVFIALDGAIEILSEGRILSGPIVIVDSNTEHRAVESRNKSVILILDAESRDAEILRIRYLGDKPIGIAEHTGCRDFLYEQTGDAFFADAGSARRIYARVISSLCAECETQKKIDARIDRALVFLRSLGTKKVPLGVIATEVNLSQGRLVHLFKEQIGIPIRYYLLWLRLVDAVGCILDGHSLTDSAHAAGFSDYAHLSRTFSRMFGYSLSFIFKNSGEFRILVDR